MTEPKRAVVTGGNRGLGLETVRELAGRGYAVVMTSRDAKSGEAALEEIGKGRASVTVAALDVADAESVRAFAARVAALGPVHALVNNAGASFRGFDADVARKTLETNFTGALRVTDALRSQLAHGANVVLVSSGMGNLGSFGKELRAAFMEPAIDRARLLALTARFVTDVAHGDHEKKGWPTNAYSVSKASMNALARVLSQELASSKIRVNAVDPGWVRTRMGGVSAPRTLAEGANGIVWAATLGDGGPTGGFFRDGVPISLD